MKPVLKPKALRQGDLVTLVAPASSMKSTEEIDLARRNVEALGLMAKVGDHALDYWGYFAGTDQHRADDLNAAFEDPEVRGVICLRGGYGAGRILDLLHYDAIEHDPKVLIGYSDITALLLGIYAKTGVVTYHGPVATSTFGAYDVSNIQAVLMKAEAPGLLADPVAPTEAPPQPAAVTLTPGTATGRLVGGNLTLVASLAGSPYLPRFDGHILFLEEIAEEPYRVDRMLNTLRISGAVKGLRGLVFGNMSSRPEGSKAEPEAPSEDAARDFTMLQVLQNFADQLKVPAYTGAWFGHIREKYTLPLGIQAEMDADARTLTITESAVAI